MQYVCINFLPEGNPNITKPFSLVILLISSIAVSNSSGSKCSKALMQKTTSKKLSGNGVFVILPVISSASIFSNADEVQERIYRPRNPYQEFFHIFPLQEDSLTPI